MKAQVTLVAFCFLALSACKQDEVFTVQYYQENPIKRAERLAECELTNAADQNANCVNAREAELLAKIDDTQQLWRDQITND